MSWTDERVELLSKLWMEGRSASQIANELGLGVTRNAVIGKVHRLGLGGRPKSAAPMAATAPRAKVRPVASPLPEESRVAEDRVEVVPPARLVPAPVIHAASDVVIPLSERVTIMDLRDSSCRWPMGDPTNAEFRFCGARTGGGSGSYCAAHSRLAFQPTPDRRRTDKPDRIARIA